MFTEANIYKNLTFFLLSFFTDEFCFTRRRQNSDKYFVFEAQRVENGATSHFQSFSVVLTKKNA